MNEKYEDEALNTTARMFSDSAMVDEGAGYDSKGEFIPTYEQIDDASLEMNEELKSRQNEEDNTGIQEARKALDLIQPYLDKPIDEKETFKDTIGEMAKTANTLNLDYSTLLDHVEEAMGEGQRIDKETIAVISRCGQSIDDVRKEIDHLRIRLKSLD